MGHIWIHPRHRGVVGSMGPASPSPGVRARTKVRLTMTQSAPELRLVESPPEPVDPLIGVTLDGRYTIPHVLGKGGMGLVYAAKHAILGKNLAIKVLKPEVSRDEQVMMRFRREAQSASAIGSPHICDVSDFGNLPD